MNIRGKSGVVTNRGPDRRRPATLIETPFVWVPGNANTSDKVENHGNIGTDFEYVDRGTTAVEDVLFASEPRIAAENAGAFRNFRAWMDELVDGTESIDVINAMRWPDTDIVDGSCLFFIRWNMGANAWDEAVMCAGSDPGAIAGLSWVIAHNSGQLKIFMRNKGPAGGTPLHTVNLGNLGAGDFNILLFMNAADGTVTQYTDGILEGSYDVSAAVDLWGQQQPRDMKEIGLALTLGDDTSLNALQQAEPGFRIPGHAAANMTVSPWRDLFLAGTHGNTAKVVSNLAAIAAAFQKAPPGHLPQGLSSLIE